MGKPMEIENFEHWTIIEKFYFFDVKSSEILMNIDSKKVQKFLKGIILNSEENSNIRKKALENFVNLVLLQKIKKRFALNLLLDDWVKTEDEFLEIIRLKKLLLFYEDESEEIEDLYLSLIGHKVTEIKCESLFQLGVASFLKANVLKDKNEYMMSLKSSLYYLEKASNCVENRVDAKFFSTIVTMLIDIIQGSDGSFQQNINKIAKLLWEQRVFSFKDSISSLEVGLYRTLNSFGEIRIVDPTGWLDYRREFNNLCYYFYQIKNQEVYNEILKSSILKNVSDNLIRRSIEPLFSINFSAEICKIEKLLTKVDNSSEEYEFLVYLKNLVNDSEVKERAERNMIYNKIINTFPNIEKSRIDNEFKKIKDVHNTQGIIHLFELFSEYSYDNLLDTIISACINLQGNRIYRDKTENERNTFLVSCLDMAGFFNKDQTLWGKSREGKTSGEIDIFIKQKNGQPFSIIEALNLDSLKKDYLELHLEKIFGYDTIGLKYNFIVVYSTSKRFSEFWNRYVAHIKKYKYPHSLKEYQEVSGYDYTNIRIGETTHIRNDKEVHLYHIVIDLG
ncbi:hypothetical protein COL01_10755 [Bacillus thuringiensis]|uniref:hypothetical protein n=1 Tax=Bacillus thuringiensis TaxID=1428 RepID=UPI000BF41FF4|nr:hypothetical protein [Bacillus thuringiensis]PFV34819.1 hypothetical protein COL01_10755 [Bacillus thuringiensis]